MKKVFAHLVSKILMNIISSVAQQMKAIVLKVCFSAFLFTYTLGVVLWVIQGPVYIRKMLVHAIGTVYVYGKIEHVRLLGHVNQR